MEQNCDIFIIIQLFLPTLRECQLIQSSLKEENSIQEISKQYISYIQSLNHNNIVKVTDFYMTDSFIY